MAPGLAPTIKPRANITRKAPYTQRVPGLGNKTTTGVTRFRSSTPARERTPAVAGSSAKGRLKCPSGCLNPTFVTDEDATITCASCGVIAEESDHLVSETTFAEGPSGQIRAQGVTISTGETHRGAGAFQATGHAGSESMSTRGRAESNAKSTIQRLCTQLNLSGGEEASAMRLFGMAYAKGFVRGRSLDDVALVCLYMTVRQVTEQFEGVVRPKYGFMLIDFAERGDIDVFALGKIFVDLAKDLFFEYGPENDPKYGWKRTITAPGPEVFVPRFVDELEFPPNAAYKIRNDAYKIITSMKRDWITRGRRPAGICGAAVILAARMNNYRRTVREVVLVAKVTEITLNKRLEEFSHTPLSKESVSNFRSQALPNIDLEDREERETLTEIRNNQALHGPYSNLPAACDPPVMNPRPKKRRRKDTSEGGRDTTENSSDEEDTPQVEAENNDAEEPTAKRTRVDAEGFAIPEQPASVNALKANSTNKKAKPGRPKGAKNWRAPPASAREKAIEREIQDDIDENMPEMQETAARIAEENERTQERQYSSSIEQAASDIIDPRLAGNVGDISMSPTLRANEFEDDLDVSTCVLNEEERQLKETIWVNENADWLRQDHAKRIRRQLKDDELREKGIDPAQFERNKKAQGRRRKDGSKIPGRHGDVAYLNDPEYDRASERRSTPGDDRRSVESTRPGSGSPSPRPGRTMGAGSSVRRMLTQRNIFTTRLNLDAVNNIYSMPSDQSTRSGSPASRASSIVSDAPTERSRSHSVSVAGPHDKTPNSEQIAQTAAQKRRRERAGLPANTDRSNIIFGGIGGKNTGLQRSKGSLSAEKRQLQVRQSMSRGSGSPSVGPSGDARADSIGSDQDQGTPEYEESVRSVSASPTPPASRTTQIQMAGCSARDTQPKNVTFAKSPPQRVPSETASGGNTPRSGGSAAFQEHAGTEEVVEGESAGGGDGEERSLIGRFAPPEAFIGDDEDDDDEDEDDDEEDEEEEEEDVEDVDPDDAFAGRLRSRY